MYIVYITSTTSNTIEVDQLNQLVPAFESDLQLEPVQKNCSFDCHSLAQLQLELIVAMACSQLLAGAVATLGIGICVTSMIQMKHAHQHWDEACVPELGLNMCTRGSRGHAPSKL